MREQPATVDDVHAAAQRMPHVTVEETGHGTRVYQVGRKSFVFFRSPRPDAVDPATGERWNDVIVIWVADPAEKAALVQDETTPFFTTSHFDGHPSVLVRASRLHETTREQIFELVEEAWLARASQARGRAWLAQQGAAEGSVPGR